jgi:hypothetical protein
MNQSLLRKQTGSSPVYGPTGMMTAPQSQSRRGISGPSRGSSPAPYSSLAKAHPSRDSNPVHYSSHGKARPSRDSNPARYSSLGKACPSPGSIHASYSSLAKTRPSRGSSRLSHDPKNQHQYNSRQATALSSKTNRPDMHGDFTDKATCYSKEEGVT